MLLENGNWEIITSHADKDWALDAARERTKRTCVTHRVVEIARYPLQEFNP